MRNFRKIFVLQLRNMFRRDRAKSSRKWIGLGIAAAVLYVLLVGIFVPILHDTAEVFASFSLESEFVALILMSGLMLVMVFGIVTVLTGLYFSKDTEFFLSLPVRPSTVFAAKLAVVYLTELITAALIMTPLLIAVGTAMHMTAVFYILLPIAVLFTPAIPLFFSSIIAIPIMYLVSFFRNRGALGSIIVLLLFGGFFTLYYISVMRMQTLDPTSVDLSGVQGIFRNIANTVYPLYALARVMTLTPAFGLSLTAAVSVNLLIYFGCIVAFGVIAFIVSATVYRRGAASQLEGAKRTKVAHAEYRSTGTVKALMKKEWKEILRTPAFAMNCLLGIIVCPIIVAFFGYTMRASAQLTPTDLAEPGVEHIYSVIMRFFMLFFILFMSTGTNSAPTTAFSREGEKFVYCKLMPVEYRTQLKAKSYVYITIGSLSSVLGVIALSVTSFDLAFMICAIVFTLAYNFSYVHFTMLLDLNRPKLKWTTPNEAVKHNRNVVIAVFAGMACAAVLSVLGGLVYVMLFAKGHPVLAPVLCWVVLFVAVFAMAAISASLLYMHCEKKFEQIEL